MNLHLLPHAVSPVSQPRLGRARGVTLVELMVAVALFAILLTVAVPSFGNLISRMRLEGATQNLATDLQYARFEAIQRRTAVTLASDAGGTAYTVSAGATPLKTVSLPSSVQFSANVGIAFDPLRGLANAAVITASSSGSASQLRVATDVMGRVQICSPSGDFAGYGSC